VNTDSMFSSASEPRRAIPRVASLLFLPPALLGLLFGLHILSPEIMATWCTTRRGCGGVRLWQIYPDYFPAIALAIGIAFASMGLIVLRPRWVSDSRLAFRMLGLGAFFGMLMALYWIAALKWTDGSLGPVGFYAPLLVAVLVVVLVEVRRASLGASG